MKILLITYHYPPDRAVGGQRAEKVVHTLRSAGHEVQVIAMGADTTEAEVYRVASWPSCRDVFVSLLNRFRGFSDSLGSIGSGTRSEQATDRSVPFWKRWIYSLLWLPDDKQGFIPPVLRQALNLPGGAPDLVYTTAPPYSVHLAGLLLRVLWGRRWVVEFRDPWTTNPWKAQSMKSALSTRVDRGLEWLCLEMADLVVSVSEGIRSRLGERDHHTPVVTIRNGIERVKKFDALPTDVGSATPFEIVYAGTFYHARDPFPFLEAVRLLVEDEDIDPTTLHVRLISGTDHYRGRSIRAYLREHGLEAWVAFEDWMEPEHALQHVEEADALLLLALDQPDQVPNKLYDYLGARRPILAVADEGGESARMLTEVGGHTLVSANEKESIRHALKRMLEQGRRGPVGDSVVLECWTSEVQMMELSAALEALET